MFPGTGAVRQSQCSGSSDVLRSLVDSSARSSSTRTPRQPVKAVDDDGIHFARTNLLRKPLKRRAVQRRARHRFIIEVLVESDEVWMPCAKELAAEVPLDLAGAQVALRAHRLPGVNSAPQRPL